MRRLTVSFLVFISNFILAAFGCGPYYPLGDDIRFTLLKPGMFNYPDFIEFSYSADLFYNPAYNKDYTPLHDTVDINIEMWRRRCKNIPSYNDTYDAVYVIADLANKPALRNSFIEYLYRNKDTEAINYLIFAKKCSPYNSIIDDPWEKHEHANVPQREKLIGQALEMAGKVADKEIQSRYAFLAIRLAYYNDDPKTIRNAYTKYFSGRKSGNLVDYWSMYFMTFAEQDSIKRNYYASQVFFFAPDKRVNIFHFYDKNIPVDKVLGYAESTEEKAAVWMMTGFRKTGKTLDVMKALYSIKPGLPGLSFLLLREVNKLEDWIYTPYYTSFNPSLESWDYQSKSYPAARIIEDRSYAMEVLSFVNSVDFRKVENPELWKIMQAYLNYITQDYSSCLKQINLLFTGGIHDPKIIRQLDVFKALCLTTMQNQKPVIRDEIKPVLMKEFAEANNKFVFAIARELEYRGNTTDAAVLLSKLRTRMDKLYGEGYWRNGIYWRTGFNHFTLYVDYYEDYFFYLDAQYTARQLEDLIDDLKNHSGKNDSFTIWKYSVIRKDVPRLYDLLGTKYLRSNDLTHALANFEKVSDTLWTSQYFPYSRYLDANPFYTNMFNEHTRTTADTVHYNKKDLLLNLICFLKIAENENNKNRDYYYFLAANCYFNMTQYGNSWLMRRYYWTSNLHKTKLEDDDEYFNCTLARDYYLKAKAVSKNEKFAALCLRMAGRCEKYKILSGRDPWDTKTPMIENIYYKKLKEEYPGDYQELIGNCRSFESYFNSRN